ncbi:MAG: DUF2178 domain-containing protein [archaeon]
MKNLKKRKMRLGLFLLITILVIITGTLYAGKAFLNGDLAGGILGTIIALSIIAFAVILYKRGKNTKSPWHDERRQKIIEKAGYKTFLVSLYILLAIGFLSEKTIQFRDISQATGAAIGLMAITLIIFSIYYSRKVK